MSREAARRPLADGRRAARSARAARDAERRHDADRHAALGAAAVLIVLGMAGAVLLRGRPGVIELGRHPQVTLDPGLEIDPALSPDGKLVAYVAGPPGQTRLFVRQVDGGAPAEVVREQGGQRFPFWTPDGRRILFQSARGIEIVPALGGTPRVLVAGSGPGLVAGPIALD